MLSHIQLVQRAKSSRDLGLAIEHALPRHPKACGNHARGLRGFREHWTHARRLPPSGHRYPLLSGLA